MNLDNMTLGDLKQIVALVKCDKKSADATGDKKSADATGRAVFIVDRGWIFAGDCSRTADGYLRLEQAVHVFRWSEIGFSRMLSEWKSAKVDLRPCDPVEIPEDAVIFRVPVSDDWGLK